MPWIFLAASALGGALTLNALRPARRSWLLVGLGFFASWLTGELAIHLLIWQAVGVAAFVWLGAASAWPGWVALGITALSWWGLARLMGESRRSARVLDDALVEALGQGYENAILPGLRERLEERPSLRQLLAPLPVYDRRVLCVRDVGYREVGPRTLRLDVYKAREEGTLRPAVLHVHGGGWIIGAKSQQGLPLMMRLAAHGWVCFSVQYRLSPRATFPDHIADVKAAIRWIREHAAAYGADPGFLAITGGSAGGHLAALAALSADDDEYQPGFEGEDTRVDACVPFYGVYDFTDRSGHWKSSLLLPMLERHILKRRLAEHRSAFDRASPASRVREDAPPFFVIHGTRDTLVPVDDARDFVAALRAVSGAPVGYAELPGAQHAFEIFPSVRTGHAIVGVERFLTWAYSTHMTARRDAPPVPRAVMETVAEVSAAPP